jgi:cyanophycin synthetase
VLEVELACRQTAALLSNKIPGFNDRLIRQLARLHHLPNAKFADSLIPLLQNGMSLAHVLQHLVLRLQCVAGSEVRFGLVQTSPPPGLTRVIIEFEEDDLAQRCLQTSRDLCLAAIHDLPFDLAGQINALRDLAHEIRLGPSTGAIVRAARQRDIPVRRLNSESLVQLGYGARQRRILTAETDRTSAIAEAIAQDKQLTRALLAAAGVPVPEGRTVANAEDAWEAAEEIGPPVVVKPQFGNHGRGVATNLATREQVIQAYDAARVESSHIVVERFAPGSDYRLLVVGGKLAAAALREPAQVVGDGHSTIRQLVEEVNRDPRRSDGHATVLSYIQLDVVGLAVLAEQGYAPESVPSVGTRVLIRRNGNLSTGGTATDVTDRVHPEVAARSIEAARVVGLDIAGVDVVATDIGRPLEEQGGAIVEVNAGPGLRMHLDPSAGKPRPVGEAIVAVLFPDGQNGRIPLIAVTGVNVKTTTTRLIAHLLRQPGRVVGMTCTDGTYLDGRRIEARDCSGPRSARAVLLNPRVHAAVLETARGGILREGLGFDRCNVAVVTNIGSGDHLNLRGIETLEDLARVKRTVVEAVAPTGTAVLNANDPLTEAMAQHCPGAVVYFAQDGTHPILAGHRQKGGRAVFVRAGSIILAEGAKEEGLATLASIPLTHHGRVAFQVENVLAAAGAVWSLGLPLPDIRAGLASFARDWRQVPGRFNVLCAGEATIIVDYAHNPSALAALVDALAHFPHQRRALVFAGCNRRDEDLVRMGAIVGNGFDRVILYADRGNRDRTDGELNALLRRGLAAGSRIGEISEADSELGAIEMALKTHRPGELLVCGVETIEEALAFIHSKLHGTGKNFASAGSPAASESALSHS